MNVSIGKLIGIFLIAMLLAVTGCIPSGIEIPVTGDETSTPAAVTPDIEAILSNTQWRLVSYGPAGAENDVIEGTDITLEFDDQGNVTGNSGCNVFGGEYEVSGNYQISITNIVSTERACVDDDLMEQESSYNAALISANLFEVAVDHLLIWYEDGQNVLRFEKSDGNGNAVMPEAPAGNGSDEAERIEFDVGATSDTVTGELSDDGSSDQYVFRALAGQSVRVDMNVTEGEAILTLWGDEDGTVLVTDHAMVSNFERELPSTQDYNLLVKGRPGLDTTYSMTVTIEPLNAPGAERIEFGTTATSTTITGQLQPSDSDLYVLQAREGQTLNVEMTFSEGSAILSVWGANGTVLRSDHSEASNFQGELPSSQDYYLLIKGNPNESTTYNLTVTVSALP